jgi:membrane-bound serine protease (ClpP class)
MKGFFSNPRVRVCAALVLIGLTMRLASNTSYAGRIKLGPLEIETDEERPADKAEPAKAPPVPVEVIDSPASEDEKADTPPYKATSESPRPYPMWPDNPVVYRAYMHDVVDLGIAPFLERVIEEAQAADADAIVIELDTPGGRVDAAVEIKDILLRCDIPTIAFINKQAISAGALIAYAHDYIIWAEGGTMGAATPIQMGGGGEAQPVEEKMTSYMRSVMRATAEAKGRDGHVAESMVDAEIDVPGFAGQGRLLTATESQADDLGLADGFADSFEEVLTLTGLSGAKVVEPELTWAEEVARFLTHPMVSSALMTIGMLGIIIEFYTPGMGFAGFVGAFALFLFFAGHLAVHLAGLEEIILFILGIALLIVEFFFIPGFGFIGLAGGLAIAASLILSLIGIDLDIAWDVGLVADAFVRFGVAIVLAGAGFALIIRYLPSLGPVKRLILSQSLKDEQGYIASDPGQRTELPGTTGLAITDLRPGGKALINGTKLDVVAQNEYIKKGETVTVLSADGPRITVELIETVEDETDA